MPLPHRVPIRGPTGGNAPHSNDVVNEAPSGATAPFITRSVHETIEPPTMPASTKLPDDESNVPLAWNEKKRQSPLMSSVLVPCAACTVQGIGNCSSSAYQAP